MFLLAHVHPIAGCKNGHPARVSSYGKKFDEIKIVGFDFSNGFECGDFHIL